MLKRLYVHNYKCLVNFEINFDKDISLFLGANGSGKSTVFEVLTKLKQVIVNEEKVENVFDDSDAPRWLGRCDTIRFELDFEKSSSTSRYILTLAFNKWPEISIEKESLFMDNDMVLECIDEMMVLHGNDQREIWFDHSRSSLSRYYKGLPFLNYLNTLFVVRINPYEMVSTFSKANLDVKSDFSNFAEWFADLNEKSRREVSVFETAMRGILPGYEYFKIDPAGQAKVLMFEFENTANKKLPLRYYFNELSEGQKVLIALYALVYCVPENSIICIDEPENFLALPEIQPWLNELRDKCKERNLQALLISHHPSLINFLATDSGYWFSRQDNHTRYEKITEQEEDGLSLAQLIEMGWIYGD